MRVIIPFLQVIFYCHNNNLFTVKNKTIFHNVKLQKKYINTNKTTDNHSQQKNNTQSSN